MRLALALLSFAVLVAGRYAAPEGPPPEAAPYVDAQVGFWQQHYPDRAVPDQGCASTLPVVLPMSVFNDEGTGSAADEGAIFHVGPANLASADHLWLWMHAPVYRDVSTNPAAKFSVRLNGGAWLDVTDATVTVAPHEAEYGGLNGSYSSVRFAIAEASLGAFRACYNVLEIRFNGTDGVSMGGRVFDMNVRTAAGADLIPENVFLDDTPALWDPIYAHADSVEAGRVLFQTAALVESPLSATGVASCSTCHAVDGRDLWYYGYDDRSIVSRSLFHGLSVEDGRLIASYIRDLPARESLGYAAPGRPWNPPFQPCEGLSARPLHEWAAGCGVEAVLEHDSLGIGYLDPDSVAAGVMIEPSDLPVAIQFPDWNEWLPDEAAADLYGATWTNADAVADYAAARAALEAQTPAQIGYPALRTMIENVTREAETFRKANAGRNNANALLDAADERAPTHWAMVKAWELHREFSLEGLAPTVYGAAYGRRRSWLGEYRDAFSAAPHIVNAVTSDHLPWQVKLVGKYFSTVWYEVQTRTNPGNTVDTGGIRPTDWNYQPSHISGLQKSAVGGPKHPVRYLQTFALLYDLSQDYAQTPYGDVYGFEWRQNHPARWNPRVQVNNGFFAALPAGGAALMDAMLARVMDRMDAVDDGGATGSGWTPGDRTTAGLQGAGFSGPWGTQATSDDVPPVTADDEYAQAWYWMVPAFRAAGVSEPTLTRVIDWGAAMWPASTDGDGPGQADPAGDWDEVRVGGAYELP